MSNIYIYIYVNDEASYRCKNVPQEEEIGDKIISTARISHSILVPI